VPRSGAAGSDYTYDAGRKLHDGGIWQFLGLMVRPLGLEPRTVSIRRGRHVGDPGGKDSCADGYDTDGQAYDRKSQ
jgi:hypothetical protein